MEAVSAFLQSVVIQEFLIFFRKLSAAIDILAAGGAYAYLILAVFSVSLSIAFIIGRCFAIVF